jgi:hypothetical protein
MRKVHTVGDSHSHNGWGKSVVSHHVGAKLAFSVGRDQLNVLDIRKYKDMHDGDSVIFSFGEIDCRCHVHKHISKKIGYIEIIDDIIEKYLETIRLNISVSSVIFRNVCVFNIVPPVDKRNTRENPNQPYLGTNEDRKKYVLYFNKKLSELCEKMGYIFFDVHDKYVDSNGLLRKDYSDGNVHIRNGKILSEYILRHSI